MVINADSMQVYRRLRILTARPSAEDEAAAAHRLYGWLEPSEVCSVGRWRTAALREIDAALAAGQVPILCGGSGFYLESLMQGLPDAPEIPADVRAAVRAEVAADPAGAHDRLATVDPAVAARLRPTDPQRLARALEIWRATDAAPSLILDRPAVPPSGLDFRVLRIAPERRALYARIDARVDAMAEMGALEEAAAVTALGLAPGLPAAKAVGLREFAAAARGDILLLEAITQTARATRRYAKRQTTWFGRRLDAPLAIKGQLNAEIIDQIVSKLQELRLTAP